VRSPNVRRLKLNKKFFKTVSKQLWWHKNFNKPKTPRLNEIKALPNGDRKLIISGEYPPRWTRKRSICGVVEYKLGPWSTRRPPSAFRLALQVGHATINSSTGRSGMSTPLQQHLSDQHAIDGSRRNTKFVEQDERVGGPARPRTPGSGGGSRPKSIAHPSA